MGRTSPTSDRGRPRGRRGRRAGFTLLELTLALAIMSLIAAVALPAVMPVRTSTDVRVRAYQVAAVLRADRNAALRSAKPVQTRFDLAERRVVSGVTGGVVPVPDDITMTIEAAPIAGMRFSPDGRASGGLLVLARGKAAYGVRVNAFTGAVDIVTVRQ